MDCSLPGSSVQGILQARAGVGCLFLLQGIFTTQGSNPRLLRLLHWQAGSLPLHHLGGYERKLSRGSLRISCLLIKTCKQMQLGIQVESAATTFTWSLFPHFGKLPRQVQSCSRTVGGPHALLLLSPRVISLAGSGRPGRRVTPTVTWERETSGPHRTTSFLMGRYKDFTAKLTFIPFRETAQAMYHFSGWSS